MTFTELDRLLRLHGNKPGFDLKNPVHRTALIWDLLPLLDGRERVELVVRELIPLGGEISVSEIAERVGLSYKQLYEVESTG